MNSISQLHIVLIFIILAFCGDNRLSSQVNYVIDSSFESKTSCDIVSTDQLIYWSSPTELIPSIGNRCSSRHTHRVPFFGYYLSPSSYQEPRTGDGYALIRIYNEFFTEIGNSEYLQTQLTDNLTKNKTYYASFYVNPEIDTFSRAFENYCADIGIAFSPSEVYEDLSSENEVLDLNPVVENLSGLITDTLNWTKVSGTFTATGEERFAIIGNFKTAAETTVQLQSPNSAPNTCPVYIDDVTVVEFDPLPDTLFLCNNDEPTLNGMFLDANYLWNTGDTDPEIEVNEAGTYIVEVFIDTMILADTTVVIDARDEEGTLFADTTICYGQTLTLSSPFHGTHFWDNGESGNGIQVNSAGLYGLVVENDCGTFRAQYRIESEDCECSVYVPTAFSPNADGRNDLFKAFSSCPESTRIIALTVYDRWGNLVFSGEGDAHTSWDGLKDGELLGAGVYGYKIDYLTDYRGNPIRRSRSGVVNLVR